MKSIRYITFFVLLLAAGCTGHTDDEVILNPNVHEFIADGVDEVVFAVDFMGENVTDEAEIMVGGVALEGSVFTTEAKGNYTFTAVYDGLESLPVTVVAREAKLVITTDSYVEGDVNNFKVIVTYGTVDVSTDPELAVTDGEGNPIGRDTDGYYTFTTEGEELKTIEAQWNGHEASPLTVGPQDFYKRVGILYFTGTWCTSCPTMAGYIKTAMSRYPDRGVLVAVHDKDDYKIDYTPAILAAFGASVLPAVTFDFGDLISGGVDHINATQVENIMKLQVRNDSPAACGIAVETEVRDNNVVATVTLKAAETMEYGLAVMLTENNIVGYQLDNGVDKTDYVHDQVLREVWQNNIKGVSLNTVEAGTQQEREATFSLANYNAENCNIVVFATSGGRLLNTVECAVGESIGFKYE